MNSYNNKVFQFFFVLIISIIGFNYFFATFLPESFKFLRLMVLLVTSTFGIIYFSVSQKYFASPIKIFSVSILLSIFASLITWNQSPLYGLIITLPVLLWPIFFLFLKFKIKIETVELVILVLGVMNTVLFFYQYYNPTQVMFNFGMVEDEFKESSYTGLARVVFPAAGIFWLFIYVCLTKVSFKKNILINILLLGILLLGIIVPMMQILRSYVVPTLIVYIYHFFKNSTTKMKVAASVLVILIFFAGYRMESPLITGMLEKQEQTVSDGTKDIRFIAAMFFLNDFSPSPINWIIGNGMGHEKEEYGLYIKQLAMKGYHASDVGIIGLFAYFGIIPIIVWLVVLMKILTIKIPDKYIYVKYYFFNVLFGAFVGSTLYHINFLMSNILALYVFQKSLENKESLKILKDKLIRIIKKNQGELAQKI